MGMNLYDALVITKACEFLPKRQRVLTLGVPTMSVDSARYSQIITEHRDFFPGANAFPNGFSDHKEFLGGLGFEEVDALDISPYEGATIVGDLNDSGLAEQIPKRYDLVCDCGTLEHIFDAPAALRTIVRLLEIGGVATHSSPANGFMDHGFWQISPDVLRTFYTAAGFRVLTSGLFVMGRKAAAVKADVNFYRHHGRDHIMENFPEALAVFAAQKMRETQRVDRAMQDYYSEMHGGKAEDIGMAFFLPYGSLAMNRACRNTLLRMFLNIAPEPSPQPALSAEAVNATGAD